MALDSLVSPELKCSYGTADMEGAATLAQDILKKNSETEVILYTATEYIDKGNFTVVNVADESDWNAAILYVKPTLEESNCYSFTVGAGCYGQSRSMTVYCELTGINGGVGTLKVSKTEYFTEAESERELLFTTDDFGGVPVTSYASMLVYLDETSSPAFCAPCVRHSAAPGTLNSRRPTRRLPRPKALTSTSSRVPCRTSCRQTAW